MKKIISVLLAVIAVMSFMLIPVSAEEEKKVSDIWVITMPEKTSYYVGEELDLTGLVLGVAYTDGSSETVDSGYTCDTTKFERKGTTIITIEYKGEPERMQMSVDYNTWQKVASIFTFLISFFSITFKNIVAWF